MNLEGALDDNMALHFSMPSDCGEDGINDLKDVAPSSMAVPVCFLHCYLHLALRVADTQRDQILMVSRVIAM